MKIDSVNAEDYPELLAVWENSVRATHDFITTCSSFEYIGKHKFFYAIIVVT